MTLTGRQIREARVLAGLSLADLAAECRIVGTPSLGRIERYDGAPPISDEYAAAIRRALEAAGIEFVPENGGGGRPITSVPTAIDGSSQQVNSVQRTPSSIIMKPLRRYTLT